jgi:hypothetical protein
VNGRGKTINMKPRLRIPCNLHERYRAKKKRDIGWIWQPTSVITTMKEA